MDTPKYCVGLDKSNGKDEGAITEGYWLNGVFTITKVHRLTQRGAICFHDFAVKDGAFDYCIKCGETRPAAFDNSDQQSDDREDINPLFYTSL